MSLTTFFIQFDNPHSTYYSGQHVTGRVFIRLSKQKKLRGIELRFVGKSSVYWREERTVHRQGKSHRESFHFNSHEIYFENNFYVLGGPSGEITLPRGEYYYPFRIVLPPTIPSSFEGEFGHVRYTAKAVISRPWRFDHECKVAFTVLNPLDLNHEPHIQNAVQYTKEKTLYCCCCKSRPITVVASLPFRGFVPGQKCQAVIEVDNPTDKTVSVSCALVQNVTFTAYCQNLTETKVVKNVVAQQKIGNVTSNSSNTAPVNLCIPAIPTSYLKHCNSISISYKIEISGSLYGIHTDINIDVPIVIGTIPLRTLFPSLVPQTIQIPHTSDGYQVLKSATPEGTTEASAPPDPFGSYPDMPPPTYEESMSGRRNIRSEDDNEYVQGTMEFAPRYPIYSFK